MYNTGPEPLLRNAHRGGVTTLSEVSSMFIIILVGYVSNAIWIRLKHVLLTRANRAAVGYKLGLCRSLTSPRVML